MKRNGNRLIKGFALLLAMLMFVSVLAACNVPASVTYGGGNVLPQLGDNSPTSSKPADTAGGEDLSTLPGASSGAQLPTLADSAPKGEYNAGVVLLKSESAPSAALLSENGIVSAEPLYQGALWYSAKLSDKTKTEETVKSLLESEAFEAVDYDYIMNVDAVVESIDVSSNPDFEKFKHFGPHGIEQGWTHMNDHDRHPGGSPDVVVAVIDTGVDYNHLDLRNNIWVNSGEIPGNGIDDDGNGYIDDVRGWNCVGDNNNPMDDNGHGTHVAGIIAAENNKIGGVGVAYNTKIMVVKAGNSSGYFNNSDIAEAVQYAYMNGASVINMSFGGSNITMAVEDALENAYTTSVLVAAAGNDALCNNREHWLRHDDQVGVSYPAALPYVIGVMSVNVNGPSVSVFTNYDDTPYDSIEYEVYAVGEDIPSTWPGNKYATLKGTSMAAPSVSGIAALLRSYYTDREEYSNKFIQSQIVNTGTVFPYVAGGGQDVFHSVANIYEALTTAPKPNVSLYDYRIDDSVSINPANNGDGVVDAGETIRLYVSLYNRGGVASDVTVTADVIRNNNEATVDPYFTFINSEITLSDIGTYSVRESGDKYFEILVSPDCPNDYLNDINIRYTYKNGMDDQDNILYHGIGIASFNVSQGFHLAGTINEDTVFTADRRYIIGEDVIIPEGVTVTFEEGCEIQFYDDREYYSSPAIIVYGTLKFNGTKENMIKIAPNERHATYVCEIQYHGNVLFNYVDAINLHITKFFVSGLQDMPHGSAENCIFRQEAEKLLYSRHVHQYAMGGEEQVASTYCQMTQLLNCFVEMCDLQVSYIEGCILSSQTSYFNINGAKTLENNIIISAEHQTVKFWNFAYTTVRNNIFADDGNLNSLANNLEFASCENNRFSPLFRQYASDLINGYYGPDGLPIIDVYTDLADESLLYPHVTKVEFFNKDGEPITIVGKEEITVRVTFNRPMDTTQDTYVTFGTRTPYADYKIEGDYVSDTVWEGKYTLKAQIENGQNYLKVNNACAKEDQTMELLMEYMLHEFTIDTAAALAMNLFAEPLENGIKLTWNQDDYDTLMGYNLYRAEEKDGNYVRINPAILLSTDEYFVDENAEPGKTYWYTFTVVLSDFTESAPAGKVTATAIDTQFPNVYHTPVNQGYLNNNLVISCTASDNVAISSVTLYYRTAGTDVWKTLTMSKVNDKYSATVFGSELELAGLEYYIVATDGRNIIEKGSAETPYTVVVKDSSALSRLGDVDGDGVITTKDALMIIQAINGDLILTDDQFQRANLNKDTVLSSVEALRILQYINGKINTLEME